MSSSLESLVSARLRTVLAALGDSAAIPASSAFQELQDALESWVPALLGWRHESIDAFRFASARKVSNLTAEFLGLCLLISDQTWTPLHLRITLAPSTDSVASVQCDLGEPGIGASGLLRLPFASKAADTLLASLPSRVHEFPWVFVMSRSAPE